MHEGIELVRIAVDDEDDSWQVELGATNGRYSVRQQFYARSTDFETFTEALVRFGDTPQDTAQITFGEDKDDWSHFVSIRAYVWKPTGAAAIHVIAKNRSVPPHEESGSFFIECEAAAVNRFGEELRRWLDHPEVPLEWRVV
jgi:hypothetical protein